MKAAICTAYGPPDVLRIQELLDPVPGAHDVIVRLRATTVSASDTYIRSGLPNAGPVSRALMRLFIGFRRPRQAIPGAVLVGEIESAGREARRFRVGEKVWGFTLMRQGCCAQRIRVRESMKLFGRAPANATPEEAAAIPYGGFLAGYFLRRAAIRPGETVAIYGAAGAIGSIAVQLAKHEGAIVTAICRRANHDLVRSLGADATLDYTQDVILDATRFDLVFDAVGKKKSSPMKIDLAKAGRHGRYVSVDDRLPRMRREDLDDLRTRVEAGTLRAVIDRTYPLDDIAAAHLHVEQGHKVGNVVIAIP